MKTLELDPEKGIFHDKLRIEIGKSFVRFHAEVDQTGNVFLISKEELRGLLG